MTEEQTRIINELRDVADALRSTNALRGQQLYALADRIEFQFKRPS